MPSVRIAGVDETGHVYSDLLPADLVTDDELTQRLLDYSPGGSSEWANVINRPGVLVAIWCPNDVQLPRSDPTTGIALAAIDHAIWYKRTAPSATIARDQDEWRPIP